MKKYYRLIIGCFVAILSVAIYTNCFAYVTSTLDTPVLDSGSGDDFVLALPPVADPVEATYTSTKSVTLSAPGSTAICYSVSSTPTCSSATVCTGTSYTAGDTISIPSGTTNLYTTACFSDASSESTTHTYIVNIPTPPPGGGSYTPPTTTTTTTTIPGVTTTTKPVAISACQWCGLACIKLQSWMYCPALTPPAGYICTEVNGVCTKVFGVPTTTTTVPPAVGTVSSLQTRIAELQAMINNLMQQLGVTVTTATTVTTIPGVTTTTTIPPVTITGIPAGFTFQKTLWKGSVSEDVRYLQRFLNSHTGTKVADTGLGSPGRETNYFGLLTKDAVIRFQNMYASEILTQWGLTKGNGYVGLSTRKKLNELLK